MTISNLQLQPINVESGYNEIMIGNSKFTDDMWDLSIFITSKTIMDEYKSIIFNFVKNEDMKFTIKLYAYYKLGKVKPQTISSYINIGLHPFMEYCILNHINS